MTDSPALLSRYLEHLHARIRERASTPTARDQEERLAILPPDIDRLCSDKPEECLSLISAALGDVDSPHLIQAIGDGLLDNLLNESAAALRDEIATLLRTSQRFRFAFASGKHASVDPGDLNDWTEILRDLGTTKQAERKRLWRRDALASSK
jgi:hypothetical protein